MNYKPPSNPIDSQMNNPGISYKALLQNCLDTSKAESGERRAPGPITVRGKSGPTDNCNLAIQHVLCMVRSGSTSHTVKVAF